MSKTGGRPPAGPRVSTRALGTAKEQLAESFLCRQGLRLVARNHRCRMGEIDLIMRDGATLVFIEVRYRHSERFGTAAATVDHRKQRRLTAAANHYLLGHPTLLPCRFDVVAISGEDRIEWIKHAFTTEP
ncbi:MAG: YraN family protein [Sphingobacteriia bacterium]|nr:YraN family protein [Sphingobacteriia bacterium]NCC39524.1 YraN family protein [Gammaproteobacteria bacterium]